MGTGTGSIDLSTLNNLHTNLTQHFWFNSNAGAAYGTGVHMTLSSQAEFIANPTGQNILMNTDGISIRSGLIPLMVLDNDSLDFNVVTDSTQGTYKSVATFGINGIQIGSADGYKSIMSGGRYSIISDDDIPVFDVQPSAESTSGTIFLWESPLDYEAVTITLKKVPASGTDIVLHYRYKDDLSQEGVWSMFFTAGTAETISIDILTEGEKATVTYDGVQTITINNPQGGSGSSHYWFTILEVGYYYTSNSVNLSALTIGTRSLDAILHNATVTIGQNLSACTDYQMVVGTNNLEAEYAAFVVGTGSGETYKNALEVTWDDDIHVARHIYAQHDNINYNDPPYIGQIYNWGGSLNRNLTANADAYVNGGTINLVGKHTYLIIAYLSLTNSTAGTNIRRVQIYNVTAGQIVMTQSVTVAHEWWGTVQAITTFQTSGNTTLQVRGSSSRPTTTIPTAWIRAICIT